MTDLSLVPVRESKNTMAEIWRTVEVKSFSERTLTEESAGERGGKLFSQYFVTTVMFGHWQSLGSKFFEGRKWS